MKELTAVLQEQFLNKRVKIQIPLRDEKGNEHLTKLNTVMGDCSWIGENKILWPGKIQVTIGRAPFVVKHINHIELV